VIRKGGKSQHIPLNPEALACIEEEVKFRTEKCGKEPAADEPFSQIGMAGDTRRFEDR